MKGVNNWGFYIYYISHQLLNFWIKSSNSIVPITLDYQQGPFVVYYTLSMFDNNEVVTNLGNEFEFEVCHPNEDVGGVGGLNYTPHLVKPLVFFTVSFILKPCIRIIKSV